MLKCFYGWKQRQKYATHNDSGMSVWEASKRQLCFSGSFPGVLFIYLILLTFLLGK